tara:strand:- start:14245 stop:15690 length:1446 start_codon:yes stop_codon:yes gene_type:complete
MLITYSKEKKHYKLLCNKDSLLTVLLIFLSCLFFSPVTAVISIILTYSLIFFGILKKHYLFVLALLLYSSGYWGEINNLVIPGVGGYLYLVSWFFLAISIAKDFNFRLPKSKLAIFILSYLTIMIILALVNNILNSEVFDSTHLAFIKKDLTFIMITVAVIACYPLFNMKDFVRLANILNITWVVANIILIVTTLGVEPHKASPSYIFTPLSYDEFQNFYFPLTLFLLFSKGGGSKFIALLLFIGHLFIMYNCGLGSQLIIVIVLLSLIYFILFFKKLSLIVFCLILFLIMNGNLGNSKIVASENKQNDIFINKTNAIINSATGDINNIPWSPRVRVIEIVNFFDKGILDISFGQIIGGYITESKLKFNFQFSPSVEDDFSAEQIKSGRFYSLHNISSVLLKFGVLFYLMLFYIFILLLKYFKKNSKFDYFNLGIVIVAVSFFNFYWTWRISFLLIILIFCIAKEMGSVVIKRIDTYNQVN